MSPMQKWLPLNNPFVQIQTNLTNLVRDNKLFTIFVTKNEFSEAILNMNQRIILRQPFLNHSSLDPTDKKKNDNNFPVIFKMCSDTLFEIPRSLFYFHHVGIRFWAQDLEEFRRQPSPSSRLWCGQIVSNLC